MGFIEEVREQGGDIKLASVPEKIFHVLVSVKNGGTLIEYEDEDPAIRRRFENALAGTGVHCEMPKFVAS